MNSTQKRFLEWPLLLMILWMLQAIEISLSDSLLFGVAHIQLVPIVLVFLALTRSWGRLALLSFVFSYIASMSSGIDEALYMSTLMWTTFIAKVVVGALALENRRSFTWLVGCSYLLFKVLLWTGMLILDVRNLAWGTAIGSAILTSLLLSIVAYYLYPVLVRWDQFFEHGVDRSRDLNPSY